VGLLGLCERAGKLASGEQAALSEIRAGRAELVILDAGASRNTEKRFIDACTHRDVTLRRMEPGALGGAVGKPGRMVAAVLDRVLANKILTSLETSPERQAIENAGEQETKCPKSGCKTQPRN